MTKGTKDAHSNMILGALETDRMGGSTPVVPNGCDCELIGTSEEGS